MLLLRLTPPPCVPCPYIFLLHAPIFPSRLSSLSFLSASCLFTLILLMRPTPLPCFPCSYNIFLLHALIFFLVFSPRSFYPLLHFCADASLAPFPAALYPLLLYTTLVCADVFLSPFLSLLVSSLFLCCATTTKHAWFIIFLRAGAFIVSNLLLPSYRLRLFFLTTNFQACWHNTLVCADIYL